MKGILMSFLLWMVVFYSHATNYYVDTTGNDNNPGTSITAPWKTVSKVNRSFALLFPGDQILFKKGHTFYGSLIVARSGTLQNNIVLGSYGSGRKPVISGFTTATGFTKAGASLWQSEVISEANKPNMVTLKGIAIPMGRFPNSGYLTIHSSKGDSSITDNKLANKPDWTGAEVIIRKRHWILSRDIISRHSDSTIIYKGNSGYESKVGYGYFIQNSVSALDSKNEWYFDNLTKRLIVFSATPPQAVKLASKDTLLNIGQYDHITVEGIAFEGANIAAVTIGSLNNQAKNNVLINCDFNFSGRDAIYAINNINCSVIKCTINHCWNNGILFAYVGGKSLYTNVSNNVIKNIGYVAGMGYMNAKGSYNTSYTGVSVSGDHALIQYNLIDTIGYNAINYYYDSSQVKYNRINYYCFVKDDGAGIYTWTGYTGIPRYAGRKVTGNIILNGIGAGKGTADGANAVQGIYLDDGTTGVIVDSNGVSNMAYGGIYVHNTQNAVITNNVVYNCKVTQLLIVHDNTSPNSPVRNLVLQNNQFISRDSVPVVIIETARNDVDSFALTPGDINHNFYYRPVNDHLTIRIKKKVSGKNIVNNYTLQDWKTTFPSYDPNSSRADITFERPITLANIDNYVRFEYAAQANGRLGENKDPHLQERHFTGENIIPPYRPVMHFRSRPGSKGSNKTLKRSN
ncbi:MAG: right-handed parallel beta-helix repeat-containing protein [Ferruginibacter sp.]